MTHRCDACRGFGLSFGAFAQRLWALLSAWALVVLVPAGPAVPAAAWCCHRTPQVLARNSKVGGSNPQRLAACSTRCPLVLEPQLAGSLLEQLCFVVASLAVSWQRKMKHVTSVTDCVTLEYKHETNLGP